MEQFFTERQEGKFTVIQFQTESLMSPAELERVGQGLYRLTDEEKRKVFLLDFGKVKYLSSQAIGVVLTLHKKLSQVEDGRLVLCGVGPQLMQLLKITRLHRLL